jgi:stage V sporulation protein D (sporulation-specific penicillin-binding protein)
VPDLTEYRRGKNGSQNPVVQGRAKKVGRESPLTGNRRGWILFIGICAMLGCFYLVYSLYGVQINQYEVYSKLASQQHWKRIEDTPVRGDILDANGNVLASTTYVYTVGITPSDVLPENGNFDAAKIAADFAAILGLDAAAVSDALAKTDATYIQLAKNVSKEQIDAFYAYVKENGIGGTTVDPVAKRYYTKGTLAAQILGYATASDGVLIGQLGIESQYNSELTGKEGYTYVEVDNYYSSALPYSPPTTIEKEDGYNVVLNIDENIQKIAEDACKDVYDVYDVQEGVTAIVMNPYTGAVLGMASYPDFDPNAPTAVPAWVDPSVWNTMSEEDQIDYIMSKAWRNRAISDTYEPGSTFKAFTTAIALEEGLTYEDEMFSDAPIVSGDYTISCWMQKTNGTNHGDETMKEAFENSCNPIFVKLAQRIGITKYYEYIHNFGFYDTTGIDLPAEGVGIFHKKPTLIDLQALSYGESSTVTPLQLANAYCALVNGGKLMTPHIAKCLTDQNGNIVKEYEPEAIRTIFSEKTAERVRALMEGVVSEGTGSAGYVEGYKVAGKTSTSTIETGEYAGLHVLSFGCYAPSDDPQIVVLVVVNKPADKLVGSSCATRTAAKIISKTLDYMGIPRDYADDDYSKLTTLYTIPDISGKTYKEARALLYTDAGGFTVIAGEDNMTDDTIVSSSFPAAGELIYKNGCVVLYSAAATERKQVVIPDFTGKDISECIREAALSGVNYVIDSGDPKGYVVSQTPMLGGTAAVSPTPGAGEAGETATPTAVPTEIPPGATPGAGDETTSSETDPPAGPPITKVETGTIIHITMGS